MCVAQSDSVCVLHVMSSQDEQNIVDMFITLQSNNSCDWVQFTIAHCRWCVHSTISRTKDARTTHSFSMVTETEVKDQRMYDTYNERFVCEYQLVDESMALLYNEIVLNINTGSQTFMTTFFRLLFHSYSWYFLFTYHWFILHFFCLLQSLRQTVKFWKHRIKFL